MIDEQKEYLWNLLHKELESLVSVIKSCDSNIYSEIRKTNNEVFPLRVYLSFLKDIKNGDEIVVSVDLKGASEVIRIDSDVSGNEGQIIADGPSFEGVLTKENIDTWILEFSAFLKSNCQVIKSNINELG